MDGLPNLVRLLPRVAWWILMGSLVLLAGERSLGQSSEYELSGSTFEGVRSWERVEAPPLTGDGAVLADARRAMAANDPNRAFSLINKWIEANDGLGNPWFPEALLIRGDAYVARGSEYKALYDYERLIRQFPQSEQFPIAIEREMGIAMEYLGGLRRRFLGIRVLDATDAGVELLIRVQERLPGSQLAEKAAIELADYYYRKREMSLASEAYDLYLLNFPSGPNRLKAEKRLIYSDVARFKGPAYDASGLIDARVRIRSFEDRYPNEAERTGINEGLIARIDESVAAQMLESALWYQTQDEWPSMRYTLRRLIQRYPQTFAAQRAIEIMGERGWWDDEVHLVDPRDAPEEPALEFEGSGSEMVEPVRPGEGESADQSESDSGDEES